MKPIYVTILFLTVFVSGCSIPDHIKPNNQLAGQKILNHSNKLQHYRFSTADWPKENWWVSFDDQQLTELIGRALKDSPSMQLANANLSRASSYVIAAESQFEPQMTAGAGVHRALLSRSEDYSFKGNTYGTIYNLGINASYSFDLWGGNRDMWEASVNSQKATEVDHQAAKIALSNSIVREYVRLANAYALHDLAKKDLKRTERIVTITQNLLNHGLTSEDHLFTAQSNAATAQQVLKDRTLTIKQLNNALATLIGAGPDIAQEIKRPAGHFATVLRLPQNLPANLLAHRPDIVAARWRVEAASKKIDWAKTRFYPNLNLNAEAGFKAMLGDAVFEPVSRSWNISPAISLPLFTKELTADLIANTAEYDSAVAQYNQTLVKALGEVSDEILSIQSLEKQLKDAANSMQLADKSYQITEKRYESGMGSQLEVLMVENQLLQSESAYILLKNKQQEAQVILVNVLGGGFDSDNKKVTTVTEK